MPILEILDIHLSPRVIDNPYVLYTIPINPHCPLIEQVLLCVIDNPYVEYKIPMQCYLRKHG